MLKVLRYVLVSAVITFMTSCTSIGVGGTVSGGSSSDVDVGVGVGIRLYSPAENSHDHR